MPRFVIQKHLKRKTHHFDLMIERNGALKTWSLEKLPNAYRSRLSPQSIKLLPDHRIHYLTWQGKISRGRGIVKIWDKGTYQCVIWRSNLKVIIIRGQKIAGYFIILSLPHRLHLIPLVRFL